MINQLLPADGKGGNKRLVGEYAVDAGFEIQRRRRDLRKTVGCCIRRRAAPADCCVPRKGPHHRHQKDEWRTKVLPNNSLEPTKSRAKRNRRVADESPAEKLVPADKSRAKRRVADESPADITRSSRQNVEQRKNTSGGHKSSKKTRSCRHKSGEGRKKTADMSDELNTKMEEIQQSAIPRHLKVHANQRNKLKRATLKIK